LQLDVGHEVAPAQQPHVPDEAVKDVVDDAGVEHEVHGCRDFAQRVNVWDSWPGGAQAVELLAMFARLKSAWHDPVWSKVISAAILGLAGLVWAVRAVIVSGVSGAIGQAAAEIAAGRAWLGLSTPVPRWLLLLMLVCIVQLMRVVRRHGKALDHLQHSYWHHVSARHDPSRPLKPVERDPEKVVDGFTSTPGQVALLNLAGHVGRTVAFKAAHRALERIDLTATWDDTVRALKVVKEAGAVRFLDDELGNGINGTMGFRLNAVKA
jgi:hypothetical protein